MNFTMCKYDKYENLVPLRAADTIKTKLPDSIQYSFKNDVTPIFRAFCYSCHSASTKNSGGQFVLDTYGGVSLWTSPHDNNCQLAKSLLWKSTNSIDNMPSGGPKLDDSLVAVVLKWVSQGAKNN